MSNKQMQALQTQNLKQSENILNKLQDLLQKRESIESIDARGTTSNERKKMNSGKSKKRYQTKLERNNGSTG